MILEKKKDEMNCLDTHHGLDQCNADCANCSLYDDIVVQQEVIE